VAPNARVGLTDESVPGDEPYLPGPKRQASRLSKMPRRGSHQHMRTRSSRSSLRSFGDYPFHSYYGGSDLELSPRASHEQHPPPPFYGSSPQSERYGHSRVYSTSSIPPRTSFGDDVVAGGLSPRPLLRDHDIGRAIG
jgi:hypothetical protein